MNATLNADYSAPFAVGQSIDLHIEMYGGDCGQPCDVCNDAFRGITTMAAVNAHALTTEFLNVEWVRAYNDAARTGNPLSRRLADIYGAELDKRDALGCDGFNGAAWSECTSCGQLLNLHPANGTAIIVGYRNV